jgi:Na+-transporting NADH:ubiquinone oxidoreductase subunit NqrB
MKFLRNLFDDAKPSFSKGGTAEKYFPIMTSSKTYFFSQEIKPKIQFI